MAKKNKELNFECPICGKKFASESSLNGHIRLSRNHIVVNVGDVPIPKTEIAEIVVIPNMPAITAIPEVTPPIIIDIVPPIENIPEEMQEVIEVNNVPPIMAEQISKEEEDFDMVEADIAKILETTIAKLAGDYEIKPRVTVNESKKIDREADLARREADLTRRERIRMIERDAIAKRGLPNNNAMQPIVHPITKKVDEIAAKINETMSGLQENQKVLGENLAKIEQRLPEGFCTTYPDMCEKVSTMEGVMKNTLLLPTGDDIKMKVSKMYGCPNCRKEILDQAKGYASEIIGDDKKLLAEIAKEKGLKVIDNSKSMFS